MLNNISELGKKTSSYLLMVKNIDLFGAAYEPRTFSKNKYKSVYGALLSVFLFALIGYKIYQILLSIISKTDYTVKVENGILNGESQILNSFYLTFCVNKSINYSNIFVPLKDSNNNIVDSIYNESNSNYFGLNCYSYNLNKLELSAKTELGDYNKIIFGSIKKEVFTKNEQLYFLPEVKYVKSDYHNPILSKNITTIIQKINKDIKIDVYLQTIQIIHKNTFDLGFIYYELINSKNYTSYYSNSITEKNENKSNLNINKKNEIIIRVFHSDIITTYIFTGFKFGQMVSDIGGYINCWMIILNLIGQKLNSYFLNKEILKELNKKDKTKIKFIHMGNNNFFKNKTLNIKSKNNSQIGGECKKSKHEGSAQISHSVIKRIGFVDNNSFSQDKSGIDNLDDSNKLNLMQPMPALKNINPIVFRDRRKSTFNSFSINKSIVRSCFSNNKVAIQKIRQKIKDNATNTVVEKKNFSEFKKECDEFLKMIYNNNDFYKDYNKRGKAIEINDNQKQKFATKLFRNFMDYGMIFNCVKELKILELILLDETNAKFFMEQKDYIYDINKLILLGDNKNLQPKLFSSMKNKEYALKQCII